MDKRLVVFTDKELVAELVKRNDHVCIELVRDIEEHEHICREAYKGKLDPAYDEEWVEVEDEGA